MNSIITAPKTMRIDEELTLDLPEPEEVFSIYHKILLDRKHLLPWLTFIEKMTAASQAKVIEAWSQMPVEKGFERILYLGDEPIGACGIRIEEHAYGEIGYWLFSQYSGKGYMTRAASFLTDTGFTEYGLNRIEIHCAKENTKSAGIAIRLGYRHEATLRERHLLADGFHDEEIYCILRKEWEENRGRI